MPKRRWIATVALAVAGGWMTFDGGRALSVGDYVTDAEGRLGPWANLVEAIGVDPRSTGMKVAHLLCGLAALAAAMLHRPGQTEWRATVRRIGPMGLLWYLPAGTALGLIAMLADRQRDRKPRKP